MNWKYLISNKDGTPSITKCAFWIGFWVATLKLLFSGMVFGGFTIPEFTAAEWSLLIGTLSATYVFRQKDNEKKD